MGRRYNHVSMTTTGNLCLIFLLFINAGVYGDTTSTQDGDSTQTCTDCCDDICTDIDCVNEAAVVEKYMNNTADPCTEFEQYACGNFYSSQKIERLKGESAVFFDSDLQQKNMDTFQGILEDIGDSNSSYVRFMKNFYDSCNRPVAIEQVGVKPFVCSDSGMSWPTLEGWDWCDEDKFDFLKLSTSYAALFFSPFFDVDLKLDMNRYVIHLRESSESSQRIIDFTRRRGNPEVQIYEQYLKDIALNLGADLFVATNDAKAVVDMLIQVAVFIQYAREDFPNKDEEEMTLKELDDAYPPLKLKQTIRAFFKSAGKGVFDFQKVIINSQLKMILLGVQAVVTLWDSRTIQNLYSFEYARSRILITRKLVELTLGLQTSLNGKLEDERRSQMCVRETMKYYKAALAKEFVRKRFSDTAKQFVVAMFKNITDAYSRRVGWWNWMRHATKRQARAKLDEMVTMLGYRDVDQSDEDLEFLYKNYPNGTGSYYETRLGLYHQHRSLWLRNLNEIFDLSFTRDISATDYEMYYLLTNNLVVGAAFLQEPRFSLTYSSAHNFAILGHLLAYHMYQALDFEGKNVDVCKRQKVWWTSEEITSHADRRQCFVDQYTDYMTSEFGINTNVNVSEKILLSDNAGLQVAYWAWKDFVFSNGNEAKLPGLNLNQDKVFFITYAQKFCEKTTEEEEKRTLNYTTPLAKYRIIGTLKNFWKFADTFACSPGSSMNPPESQRCNQW